MNWYRFSQILPLNNAYDIGHNSWKKREMIEDCEEYLWLWSVDDYELQVIKVTNSEDNHFLFGSNYNSNSFRGRAERCGNGRMKVSIIPPTMGPLSTTFKKIPAKLISMLNSKFGRDAELYGMGV